MRRGKWVMTPEGVGIVVSGSGLEYEVHLVDELGETVMRGGRTYVLKAHAYELREATIDEIPAPRRPAIA